MSIRNSIIHGLTSIPYREFDACSRDPVAATEATWRRTWGLLRRSPHWKQHAPKSGLLRDFPVTSYSDYQTAIQASWRSGVSRLNGERVLYFSESSGTTGVPKPFPTTRSFLDQTSRTFTAFAHSFFRRFPGCMDGRVLFFAAVDEPGRSPTGIRCGADTNYTYRSLPRVLRHFYALPAEVLRDEATFATFAPVYGLCHELSAMIAVTPHVVLRFARLIEERREEFLAIISGATSLPRGLPPLSVSPIRLAHLRAVLARRTLVLTDLWPTLKFICCWKGSVCAPQLPALERVVGGCVPIIEAPYSPAEGAITVPLDNILAAGPVHAGAHVVEFLPAGASSSRELVVPSWALRVGEDYDPVITTAMGLVRYRMNDVMRCVGFHHRSPIIEFRSKASSLLSLGEAKLGEDALVDSCRDAQVELPPGAFFGPNSAGDGLSLYYRGEGLPSAALTEIDGSLVRRSPEYGIALRSGVLVPIDQVCLAADHPVWATPVHAQSKPVVLRPTAPTG